MDEIQSIFSFLDAGVSPWHAAAEAGCRLTEAGYERLDESQPWSLVPGGGSLCPWRQSDQNAPGGRGRRALRAHIQKERNLTASL